MDECAVERWDNCRVFREDGLMDVEVNLVGADEEGEDVRGELARARGQEIS